MNPRQHKLTAAQVILVLLAVAVLGGGGYASYGAFTKWRHDRGVRANVSKYLDGMRAQRDELVKVIEAYHKHFGFYPPNRLAKKDDSAEVSPLYYELAGTRWHPPSEAYYVPTSKDPVRPAAMQDVFRMQNFSNSLPFPAWPTNFLEGLPFGRMETAEGIIQVSSGTPDGIPDEYSDGFEASAWHYVTEGKLHNSQKFDLWIEIDVAGKHFVIGNWPEAQ